MTYDFKREPVSASVPPPPRSSHAGTKLAFGRYSGWALRDLARQDPDYLRWLSRHASGLRYRTEIYQSWAGRARRPPDPSLLSALGLDQ